MNILMEKINNAYLKMKTSIYEKTSTNKSLNVVKRFGTLMLFLILYFFGYLTSSFMDALYFMHAMFETVTYLNGTPDTNSEKNSRNVINNWVTYGFMMMMGWMTTYIFTSNVVLFFVNCLKLYVYYLLATYKMSTETFAGLSVRLYKLNKKSIDKCKKYVLFGVNNLLDSVNLVTQYVQFKKNVSHDDFITETKIV